MTKALLKIGIIGGAGPLAGALLFEKIVQACQTKYGCWNDADFPSIFLLSYPFCEMLREERSHLREQLEDCFQKLILMGADLVVIACNTLHAFLPPIPKEIRLIHLIDETLSSVKGNPLVLATSTSARYRLHAPYRYPSSSSLQKRLDEIVDQVLAGKSLPKLSEELAQLLNRESDTEFLLGCTEFSLLNERHPLASFGLNEKIVLCDPYAVIAEKISSLTYGDNRTVRSHQ